MGLVYKNKEYDVFNKLPNGWSIVKGATTAPVGYRWIHNGKSRFSKERKLAFLKEKGD